MVYHPGPSGDALWASDPADLLTAAPKNTHVFFVSTESRRADRRARLEDLEARLDVGDKKRARVHLVLDRLDSIEGSVGAMATAWGERQDAATFQDSPLPDLVMFGIDAEQRFDPGGSPAQYVGGPDLFEMAGYLGGFYNHKANLAHRLDAEEATVVTLLDARVSERVFVVDATLPSPADMAGFDTVELDVQVTCPHASPFDCSEWDRIARVELCLDGADCADRRELVRWITPYWRRGTRRWALDASPLLPLLAGGDIWFRIEMGPEWEAQTERDARFDLRLSTRGTDRAQGAELVYTGGVFDDGYAAAHPPVDIDIPAEAARVELVTLLSGHGQDGATGCAEWCDHVHTFAVDGVDLPTIRHEGASINSLDGCAARASEGVPPGQWGNWAPTRAYWCPGLPVAPIAVDMTDLVTPGGSHSLSYAADRGGGAPPGGGDIVLSAYVVWY